MTTTLPRSIKLWGRGQLTIPKDMREALKIDDVDQLSAFTVGPCLMLTPKRLTRAALAKNVEKSIKTQGIGLDDLLDELKAERKRYIQENYAR